MTDKFIITGMGKPKSFTFFHYTNWWAVSALPEDRFNALFDWAKKDDNFWKQNIQAVVEYDSLAKDGTPINGKVIEVLID